LKLMNVLLGLSFNFHELKFVHGILWLLLAGAKEH